MEVWILKEYSLKSLKCPICGRVLDIADIREFSEEIVEATIVCKKGHTWEIEKGIPKLVHPPISKEDSEWIAQYDKMAENYDELVKRYDEWLGINMMKERERFTLLIPIESPARIIDVSIGTAANYVALQNVFKNEIGRFNLNGLDLSLGMLRVAKRKAKQYDFELNLIYGSVYNIPFQSGYFDIVLHSGGINTFSDISKALEEMLRVVKPWGFVVVTDEGLSPEMRETEKGKKIMEENSLFESKPPLEYIPEEAREFELQYIMNGTFYEMIFRK